MPPHSHPFPNDYNQNDYNYNYSSGEDTISESFEYFLICVLVCGSWLSCFDLIKTCSANCIKSCRTKNRVTIKKVDSDDEDNLLNECSICLENYKKDDMIIILACNHNFHESCLKEWSKNNNSCPHCRENII
jgi:hypothetical protein